MEARLFLYYPRKDLELILEALHACAGVRVQLLDAGGKPLLAYGAASPYCLRAERCLSDGRTCEAEHSRACRQALGLGEPYVFCCHSGVYHVIYPILNREELFGSVLLGPFLMDGSDEDLIKHLARSSEIPTDTVLELYKDAQSVPEFSPERVVQLSRLLYYLVGSLVAGSRELQAANRSRLQYQSKASAAIRHYKMLDPGAWKDYPFREERALISEVRAGSVEHARAALTDLIACLTLYERHDPEGLRTRMTEVCALMSRAAVERGADAGVVLDLNRKLLRSIAAASDLEEIGFQIYDNMEIFTENRSFSSENGSRLIMKATRYIREHFSDPLTLKEAADDLGVSAPYLSKLFHEVTHTSFRDYLNKARVEMAKQLLSDADYPILEIAVACGFSDQSYFTKVFKKYTGMSPGKFRLSKSF